MVSGDSAVLESFDPFGQAEDSVAQGNVELGNLPIIGDVALGGSLKLVFIVLNMILQTHDLSLEVVSFNGCLSFMSGDCGEEVIGHCLEDVWVEFGMGSEGHCNGIGQHRWFQTLDQSDWEGHGGLGR